MRSGGSELFVQGVTKPATLIHRADHLPLVDLLLHPLNQLLARHLRRQPNRASPALPRHRHRAQLDVQSQLPHHRFAVATATEPDTLERTVMKGCCVVFHNHKRVPVLPTLYNPSWHLSYSMPRRHSAESPKLFEEISRPYLDHLSRECRDWPAQPNSTCLWDQDAKLRSDGLLHFRYLPLRRRPSRGRDVRNGMKAAIQARAYKYQLPFRSPLRWLASRLVPQVLP